MNKDSNSKVTFVEVLALAQGILAVVRSLHWFDIGNDLMEGRILLLPALAQFVYLRGAFIAVIALLYVLFALGEFAGRGWAGPSGTVAAILNLLLVIADVAEGEVFFRPVLWAVVPVVVLWHAFASPKGCAMQAHAA